MGIRRARRIGAQSICLGPRKGARRKMDGEHLAGLVSEREYRRGWVQGAGTGRQLRAERLWPARHGGQRLGMVRRLVSAKLLREKSADQSDRSRHQLRSERTGGNEAGDAG